MNGATTYMLPCLGFLLAVGCVNSRAAEPLKVDADKDLEIGFTLALWNRAAVARDRDVLRAFLWADNDASGNLIEAQTQRILSVCRLYKALEQLKDQKDFPFSRFHLPGDFFSLLVTEWEVRDNRAVQKDAHRIPDEMKLPTLINVGGIWKINVTPVSPPASLNSLADAIRRQAQVVDKAAEAVEAGTLKTVEQVKAALEDIPTFAPATDALHLVLSLPHKGRQEDRKE